MDSISDDVSTPLRKPSAVTSWTPRHGLEITADRYTIIRGNLNASHRSRFAPHKIDSLHDYVSRPQECSLCRDQSGLVRDHACAEQDNRCANTATANMVATQLVIGVRRIPDKNDEADLAIFASANDTQASA